MNHIYAMFDSDPDDVFLREISAYRSKAFSYLISFIGLRVKVNQHVPANRAIIGVDLLTMGRQTIFKGVDRDSMHSQFMGRTKNANRDFLIINLNASYIHLFRSTHTAIRNKDLG